MSVNIINTIKEYLNPSVASSYATNLGESEAGISKAFRAIVPIMVGSIINHQGKFPELYQTVKDLYKGGILDGMGVPGNSENGVVASVYESLFGKEAEGLSSTIANYAGIKDTSANSLINVSGTGTLGAIGKHVTENNLSEEDFHGFLENQKNWVSAALPAGLSLGALGLGGLANTSTEKVAEKVTAVSSNVNETVPKVEDKRDFTTPPVSTETKDGGSIWKWLLPLIFLLLAVWFFWKQCAKSNNDSTMPVTTDTRMDDTTTNPSTSGINREVTTLDLNGTQIKGYRNGIEEQLITFLKSGKYDSASENDLKDQWYNFDNVNFVFGKTNELEAGSQEQVNNIAAILKAYPNAKIKIGAYTDKKGDAVYNKKISQERADFIKAQLTNLGVGNQLVSAEGYGSEFATVPVESSDEQRAVDRRIAVRFTK